MHLINHLHPFWITIYTCSWIAIIRLYMSSNIASSRTLHKHLFRLGFMPNYICWAKHEENGDDENIIRGFAEYGAYCNGFSYE